MQGIGARLRSLTHRYGATFLSFGAMQAMQFLLPLLALPWLSRILGPEAFGLLMYMCLIPPLAALCMDWGLAGNGARMAARQRDRPADLRLLLGAALGAKLLLATACILIALATWPFFPHATQYPAAYWLAVLAGLGRGLAPVWFFQGTGKGMPVMAAWDTGATATALILVFIFIRSPERWPLYLLITAICRLGANGVMTLHLCTRYQPWPDLKTGLRLMRSSAVLAGSGMATMFCQNGSQIALGYFLSAEAMGILVAVNKMLRSLVACLNPVTQALYPELCRKSRHAGLKTLKWSLLLVIISASLCAVLVLCAAPLLIDLALGHGYEQAATALRIAILAAPLMALNYALANQALIPFDLENKMLAAQAGCALASLPAAALLGGCLGLVGGAFLPVCIEGLLALALGTILQRNFPVSRNPYLAPIKK